MMDDGTELIARADRLAEQAHGGQVRKYTAQPYIEHPRSVAALVTTVPHTPQMVAAALLHDVLEDTTTTADELIATVGAEVTRLVIELTEQTPRTAGNRALRKELEAKRLAAASPQAQTVKYADLIHNLDSIVANDRGFARVFVGEMLRLVEQMTRGDATLRAAAYSRARDAQDDLAESVVL